MPIKRRIKRAFTAIIGGIVVVVGIILIPYPGPGWLVVFAGLGILSTEFDWAKRLLSYAREKYDGWVNWLANQNMGIQLAVSLVTTIIVIATIWLVNGYGIINHLLNLGWDWVDSPLPIFN